MSTWINDSPKPQAVVERFKVLTITHLKNPAPPEHEYLMIETMDVKLKEVAFLILERNVSTSGEETAKEAPLTVMEGYDRNQKLVGALEQIKRIASTSITAALAPSQLAAMEEGKSSKISLSDVISVSSTQSAGLVSDSLNKSKKFKAMDRILGEAFMTNPHYFGQVVQYFKPQHLTLYDFALFAHVVHESNPFYSILNTQCYYYAALVYAAAERYSQELGFERGNHSKEIYGSHLSDKYGRWNGLKVTSIARDSLEVDAIISLFKTEHQSAMSEFQSKVFLCSDKILMS